MTKQIAAAFGLGTVMPLLCALYLGGENVAQAGLRLAAIEQGFSLASRHWQFEATPAHEITVAQWDGGMRPSTTAKKPTKTAAKAR